MSHDPNFPWQGGGVAVHGDAIFTSCTISQNTAEHLNYLATVVLTFEPSFFQRLAGMLLTLCLRVPLRCSDSDNRMCAAPLSNFFCTFLPSPRWNVTHFCLCARAVWIGTVDILNPSYAFLQRPAGTLHDTPMPLAGWWSCCLWQCKVHDLHHLREHSLLGSARILKLLEPSSSAPLERYTIPTALAGRWSWCSWRGKSHYVHPHEQHGF